MNSFVNALNPRLSDNVRTFNGAPTHDSSGKAIVDLFFLSGASRGKDLTPVFVAAYNENKELAIRAMLYSRDVREGQGEREHFRKVLRWLEKNDPAYGRRVLPRVSELGRFDDLLVLEGELRNDAFHLYAKALAESNGLAAKWAPRKGPVAVALREFMGLTPKQYRKLLVKLSKTVEQKMCANEWSGIIYDHVPSVASARYRKAFYKHDPVGYAAYVAELSKPGSTRKVNASAIYPYEVIRQARVARGTEYGLIEAQWKSLPDYVGNGSFIPMIDVSGSMGSWGYYIPSKNKMSATPMDVAISLGLYCAERNKSAFKDVVVAFTDQANIYQLQGDLQQRIQNVRGHVGYSTNLQAGIEAILNHAKKYDVAPGDMPEALLVLSDMEFNDSSIKGTMKTNHQSIQEKYAKAGYTMPRIVYWNLNGREGNSPVTYTDHGTALVSGFSPSIMKNVLANKNSTPLDLVLDVLMKDRYAF